MSWGTITTATQLTAITTEQYFTAQIALAGNEFAQVEIKVDFPASPTDHAIINVYATVDDSSEQWSTTPIMSRVVDKALDPNIIALTLDGVRKVRIGIVRTGTTDTITSADMRYRVWTP